MIMIGFLGNIPFSTGDVGVLTPSNISWGASANIATHTRHKQNALTEFTGLAPETISFDIYLSKALNANVWSALEQLWGYERGGTAVDLIIGSHCYGRYKWLIESHTIDLESFSPSGELLSCTISLSLVEHLKE